MPGQITLTNQIEKGNAVEHLSCTPNGAKLYQILDLDD